MNTLSNPVFEFKIEASIPCGGKTIRKSLRKKLLVLNSKTVLLEQKTYERFHQFCFTNLFDVPLTLVNLKMGDREELTNIVVRAREVYSNFLEVKEGSSDVTLKYQIGESHLVM